MWILPRRSYWKNAASRSRGGFRTTLPIGDKGRRRARPTLWSDPVRHRIDVHPCADRREDDVVAALQGVAVELSLRDQVEHRWDRGHGAVAEPGDRHRQ